MNVYLEYHKANPGKIYAGSVWDREHCWSLEAEHGMLRYWQGRRCRQKGGDRKLFFGDF
jgi:hypothetical protein